MKNFKGFSLIELLISLLILSSLAWMALSPASLKSYNDSEMLVNDIKNAIQYSKMQALLNNETVYLSPLNASTWSQGIKLTKSQSRLLRSWSWNYPDWEISWNGVSSSAEIQLSPSPLNAMSNGTLTLIHKQTKKHLELILNKVGRIKIKQLIDKVKM